METKKVHLGLDLGIASVGWSLVDSEQGIIAMGSHLFKQLSDPKDNKKYGEGTRGEQRRARRNLSRKKQRKLDFLNMIDQFSYNNQIKLKTINKISSLYKPEYQKIFGFNKTESATDFLFRKAHQYDFYKIYRKGFEKELNPKELFLFLYQKLSVRGAFYLKYNEKTINDYTYEDSLFKNVLLGQYFKQHHKFRDKSNGDKSFSIFWNWLDIEFILRKCSYISENFIEDYKKIFLRHRHFSHGPGWSDPLSPWSVDYDENRNPIGHIWDKKIGFCPVSLSKNDGDETKAQKRLNQFYFIAELSSLISQLVYTKLDEHYLTNKEILIILNKSIFSNQKVNIKNMAKWLNHKEIDFSNYPRDKDLTKDNFEENKKLRRYFDEKKPIIQNITNHNISDLFETLVWIDEKRFELILEYWEDQKDKTALNNKNPQKCLDDAKNIFKDTKLEFEINYENLINFNDVRESDLNGTRSFGYNAYKEYLDKFLSESTEHPKEFDSFNVHFKKERESAEKYKYSFSDKAKLLPLKMFEKQEFLSPNVKNTLQEAIRVIDNVLKRYIYKNAWILESIILETTWDSENLKNSINSQNRKKEISQYQKFMEKSHQAAEKELAEYGITASWINKRKYFLWKEQDSKDFYSGLSLELREIEKWQVDHIIPESISFNSNLENLVVTVRNEEKGKRTPFEFLGEQFHKLKYGLWKPLLDPEDKKEDKKAEKKEKEEKQQIPGILKRIRKQKLEYLTMEKLEEKVLGFINSNLSETTYAIRKLKEGLIFFIKNFNEKFSEKENSAVFNALNNCEIRTISGNHSQRFRRWMEFEAKDRKIAIHHAHDASIIALYSSFPEVDEWYKWMRSNDLKVYYAKNFKSDRFNNKYKTIDFNLLKGIFSNPDNQLVNKITSAPFYYSFKPYKLDKKLNNTFYKQPIEKQWEIVKTIKPKQIFTNENFNGYQIIDDKKYQVIYWNLLDDTKAKNVFELFQKLHNDLTNGKSIVQHCQENQILTDPNLVNELYKLIDKNLFDKSYEEHKKLLKKDLNIFKNINEKVKIDLSIFNNLIEFETKIELKSLENQAEYLGHLLNNYILIIKDKQLIKVNKIKIISDKEYFPTYELINKNYETKSSQNKYIFNKKYQSILSHNQTLLGDSMKMIALLKFDDDDKEKIEFFKVNQLNEIVRAPKKYEMIKLIDPNIWYYFDNNIWELSTFAIAGNQIWFSCVSDKNKKNILKKYTKGNWKEEQELFNKMMRIKK